MTGSGGRARLARTAGQAAGPAYGTSDGRTLSEEPEAEVEPEPQPEVEAEAEVAEPQAIPRRARI